MSLRGVGRGRLQGSCGARASGAHHVTSSSSPDENSSLFCLPKLGMSDLALSDLTGFVSGRSTGAGGIDSERLIFLSSTRPPVDSSSCRCSKVGSWSSGVPSGGGASLPNSKVGRSASASLSRCFCSSCCLLMRLSAPCASWPEPRARSAAAWRSRRSLRRCFSFQICGDRRRRGGGVGGRSGDDGARVTGGSGGGGRQGGGGGRAGAMAGLRRGGLRRGGPRGGGCAGGS